MSDIGAVVMHAFMISGFVAVMMLVIEYINVLSQGQWQQRLGNRRWGQYLLAAGLGATPGCLGAFAVVAMYSHGRISLGAVVAAMIATSGDESFVLFALVPKTALELTLVLFAIGLAAGALTDRVLGRRMTEAITCRQGFHFHQEEHCRYFEKEQFVRQWRNCSAARGILSFSLLAFIIAIATGQIGPPRWDWIRATLLGVSLVAAFIVTTVPEHFLEDHLWKHVVREHALRVFLWTLGSLLVLHLVVERWEVGGALDQGRWIMLLVAGLVGLVPESGPHLIFVTMYAEGLVPFGVLLTSSIVQDGHGMLPLLAHSRPAFVAIKLINLAVGLLAGSLWLAAAP